MLYLSEETKKGLHRVWALTDIAIQKKTKFQQVVIANTPLGMTLFCDGQRQSSEQSQLLYHEGQVYPGLWASYWAPRNLAIVLGSSEGVAPTMLRQFYKKVIHIDIDSECLELCARFLPYGYSNEIGENGSSQLEMLKMNGDLLFEDGKAYIEKQEDGSVDLIVLDLPEMTDKEADQHNQLYTDEFLATIRKKLSPEGVLITEAGSPTLWRSGSLKTIYERIKKSFPQTIYFDLIDHEWAWICGKNGNPVSNKDLEAAFLATLPAPQLMDIDTLRKGLIIPKTLRG